MALKFYCTLQALNEKTLRKIVDVGKLHEAPDIVYKDVATRNEQTRTHARQIHNAKTQVLPLNINIGDFVMVNVSSRRKQKLQTKWKGLMRVRKPKLHLLFVVEDINHQHKMTAHAQRLVPYSLTNKHLHASRELQQRAGHYKTVTQIIEWFGGVRENSGEYEVLVDWLGWERTNDTWKSVKVLVEDVPALMKDSLYTAHKGNLI